MEDQKNNAGNEPVKPSPNGLDQWNDRLDENLETGQTGDVDADEKAREYSEEKQKSVRRRRNFSTQYIELYMDQSR